MKRLLIVVLVFFATKDLSAQQKASITITRDTINISGYVYNYDGTPCAGATIQSRQRDTVVNLHQLSTLTDRNGYFKLNGVKFNDTLSFFYFSSVLVYNKGSRNFNICLPVDVNKLNVPIKITARRLAAKPSFTFTTNTFAPPGIFVDVEKGPQYPGGIYRYRDDILKQLSYPPNAIIANIEGNIEIGFTVLRDGTLSDYKVLKGLGYGCEDEVIQIMKSLPKWKPGIQNGRPVEANYTIEIEFKLTDS